MRVGNVEIEARGYSNLFAVTSEEFDGMAVFVMCGLTGFRPQSYDFINSRCKFTGAVRGRVRHYVRDDGVHVACDLNRDNHVYVENEIDGLLGDALTVLSDCGARNIVMNGIRSRISPNPRITDTNERDTLSALIRWIVAHPESGIEKVTCLSGGGEFERVLQKCNP